MTGDQVEGILVFGFIFLFVLGLVAIIKFTGLKKKELEIKSTDAVTRRVNAEMALDAQRFANANAMSQKTAGATP